MPAPNAARAARTRTSTDARPVAVAVVLNLYQESGSRGPIEGMFKSGYLKLGTVAGACVRAHWTVPVGALVFGGGRISLGSLTGFVLLVLAHEIGHALVVRRRGYRVVCLELHGTGGLCRWRGDPTAMDAALIAWGGVGAQALVLVGTMAVTLILGSPRDIFFFELVRAFTTTNLWMIGFNLIPIPPLDGVEAWKMVRLLRQRARNRVADRRLEVLRAGRAELAAVEAAERNPPSPEVVAGVDNLLDRLSRGDREAKK